MRIRGGLYVLILLSNIVFAQDWDIPDRPKNVPTSAKWAGHPHTNAWILCSKRSGKNVRYYCEAFLHPSGERYLAGEYILSVYVGTKSSFGTWEKELFEPIKVRPAELEFIGISPESISVDHESFDRPHFLRADGVISFSGECRKYEFGIRKEEHSKCGLLPSTLPIP